MSDQGLLGFGCSVSFIALAGVYVYLRASFERGKREPQEEIAPVVEAASERGRAA